MIRPTGSYSTGSFAHGLPLDAGARTELAAASPRPADAPVDVILPSGEAGLITMHSRTAETTQKAVRQIKI